jgi:hypothetical protein
MQTIIALSTAESELIALSEVTRFVRSITYIIDELQTRGLLTNSRPKIHCKVFDLRLQTNESQLNQSKRARI